MKKKIWRFLLILFVVIQLIPYSIKNEAVNPQSDLFAIENVNDKNQNLVRAACYDCHSQQAKKPWYAYIAPIKFWVNLHVRGGRKNLDFSKWAALSMKEKNHKLEECIEMVTDKKMPLNSYTWIHSEAKLSDSQHEELVRFFEGLKK